MKPDTPNPPPSPRFLNDLHSHSSASDGESSPAQLVDLAAEAGVKVLALTDHDTIAGVPAAIERGRARGVEVIPGCELTIYEGDCELHLLALFIDSSPGTKFSARLEELQKYRLERALLSASKLRQAGFAISGDDVLEAARGAKSVGRPHVAAALAKRGYAASLQAAFHAFLEPGGVGYVPMPEVAPEEAFAAIHAGGGLAILAHPGALPHDELIAPLFRRGLDGLEVWHPSHSEVNRHFYAGLARRYGKLVSGGSDYHGPIVKPGVNLGDAGVDAQTLAQLRQAADF